MIDSTCWVVNPPPPCPVSYTHLDVYKRQLCVSYQISELLSFRFARESRTGFSYLAVVSEPCTPFAVSYTHLDVYKRQVQRRSKLVDGIAIAFNIKKMCAKMAKEGMD